MQSGVWLICGHERGNRGLCDDLLRSGDTCTEDFDVGQANNGYCDLTCGFCDEAQDKMGLLNPGRQVDLTGPFMDGFHR